MITVGFWNICSVTVLPGRAVSGGVGVTPDSSRATAKPAAKEGEECGEKIQERKGQREKEECTEKE